MPADFSEGRDEQLRSAVQDSGEISPTIDDEHIGLDVIEAGQGIETRSTVQLREHVQGANASCLIALLRRDLETQAAAVEPLAVEHGELDRNVGDPALNPYGVVCPAGGWWNREIDTLRGEGALETHTQLGCLKAWARARCPAGAGLTPEHDLGGAGESGNDRPGRSAVPEPGEPTARVQLPVVHGRRERRSFPAGFLR